MKIVVDSYAWIELFIGSKKGSKAREIIIEAEEVYTPDFVLAEIARKYLREGVDQQTILERLRKISESSDVTSISVEAALNPQNAILNSRRSLKKLEFRLQVYSMPWCWPLLES